MTASGNSGIYVKRETRMKRDSFDSFTDVASVSSSGKDLKQKPSNVSFDALSVSFADVGGVLTVPASPSSPASTFGSASFIESQKDNDEDLDIEISSLRYSITPPDAAHVKNDSSNMV